MAAPLRLGPNLCPSMTKEIYDKFVKENINTSIELLARDPEELSAKIRVSYKIIQNICKVVNAYHGAFQKCGVELYKQEIMTGGLLPTGLKRLDKFLEGGLLIAELIEIYGLSGCGKTSLTLSLSCQAALKEHKKVLYLDPFHSINSTRIKIKLNQIRESEEDIEKALSDIHFIYPENIWEVIEILEDSLKNGNYPFNQTKTYDLLVIDSLSQLILPVMGGSYFESFGLLNYFGKLLMKTAKMLRMTIVIVNGAVKNSEDSSSSIYLYKPPLGRYWMHVPHTRIFMERLNGSRDKTDEKSPSTSEEDRGEQRVVIHVTKSTRLRTGFCFIDI